MSQFSAAAFAGRMRWVFGGLAGIMAVFLPVCCFWVRVFSQSRRC